LSDRGRGDLIGSGHPKTTLSTFAQYYYYKIFFSSLLSGSGVPRFAGNSFTGKSSNVFVGAVGFGFQGGEPPSRWGVNSVPA